MTSLRTVIQCRRAYCVLFVLLGVASLAALVIYLTANSHEIEEISQGWRDLVLFSACAGIPESCGTTVCGVCAHGRACVNQRCA